MNAHPDDNRCVDWDVAGAWGARLTPAGSAPSRDVAHELVAELRAAATRAREVAREVSGLAGALAAPTALDVPPQVLVVDRAGWSRAAAASFAGIARGRPMPGSSGEAGAVLALLATRVLGQFDPHGAGGAGGRLLLVAPNVLRSERTLAVDARDFRLWVCVHEQTHALQFGAAPWLVDHIHQEMMAVLDELTETSGAQDLRTVVGAVAKAARARDRGQWSLLDIIPAVPRERVERLTAVMSLLEGHADVTMDAVGPGVIPTAARLRSRLDAKRRSTALPDRLLRRLLGLDVKLAQYRDGASFVRTVRQAGGPDALDAVWAGPEWLPTPEEITDGRAWLRRVDGASGR